jgi:hypothetical protein
LSRRLAPDADVTLQHRQEPLAVGRVAGFDHQIEDHAAPAGGQIELVAIMDVAAGLDDDIGMRLEQAHQLVAGRHRLAGQHPPFSLGYDLLDQRPVVANLSLPHFASRARRQGQLFRSLLQIIQGVAGDPEQLAIALDPFGTAAAVLDRPRPLLRHSAVIVPLDRAAQGIRLLQQPHHHPHGIPQQSAVARLVDERRGDGAVDPNHIAAFQLVLPSTHQQRPIDLLPALGPDHADRLVQDRLSGDEGGAVGRSRRQRG